MAHQSQTLCQLRVGAEQQGGSTWVGEAWPARGPGSLSSARAIEKMSTSAVSSLRLQLLSLQFCPPGHPPVWPRAIPPLLPSCLACLTPGVPLPQSEPAHAISCVHPMPASLVSHVPSEHCHGVSGIKGLDSRRQRRGFGTKKSPF
eukprot:1141827-Rhodomonas_salina.1